MRVLVHTNFYEASLLGRLVSSIRHVSFLWSLVYGVLHASV
jgi:hypothetical protein